MSIDTIQMWLADNKNKSDYDRERYINTMLLEIDVDELRFYMKHFLLQQDNLKQLAAQAREHK